MNILAWLHPLAPSWLYDDITELSESGDLAQIAAVGLYLRLGGVSWWTPAQAMAGLDAHRSLARKWVGALSIDRVAHSIALRQNVDLAVAEVELLGEKVGQLQEEFGQPWAGELLELLVRRDNLESVYHVMDMVGLSTPLGSALFDLDARMEAFFEGRPRTWVKGPRLDMVAKMDFESWWAHV
jgi:hypothetical protein